MFDAAMLAAMQLIAVILGFAASIWVVSKTEEADALFVALVMVLVLDKVAPLLIGGVLGAVQQLISLLAFFFIGIAILPAFKKGVGIIEDMN